MGLWGTVGQEHVGAIPGSGDTSRGGLNGFAVQRAGLVWEAVAACSRYVHLPQPPACVMGILQPPPGMAAPPL